MLQGYLGPDNLPFIDLIGRFLKTNILDRKGRNYACYEVGIPQGSPLSPVLMNCFLHSFDLSFSSLATKSQPINYLRYADDLLFGIPVSPEVTDPLQLKETLRTLISKEFQLHALEYSWVEYKGPTPIKGRADSPLDVLGLLVSFSPTGEIRVNIPKVRWSQRLTWQKVRGQMEREGLKENLHSFLRVMLDRHIEAYLRYAMQHPFTKKEKIVRFFHHLMLERSSQFIRETKCQDSGMENQTIPQVKKGILAKLQEMVKSLERKMAEKYH